MGLLPNAKELADAFGPVVDKAEDHATADITGEILPALQKMLTDWADGLKVDVNISITVSRKPTA